MCQVAADTAILELELEVGLPVEVAYERAQQALRFGDLGARKAAFYLADIEERRVFVDMNCASMRSFFRKRFRQPLRTLYSHLEVGRELRKLRRVAAALDSGALNWSMVRELIKVVIPSTEPQWIEWASPRTSDEVAREVAGRDKGDLPGAPRLSATYQPLRRVGARLTPTQYERWRQARGKLSAELGRLEVSDEEMMFEAATLLLSSDLAGDVPGRVRLKGKDFFIPVQRREGQLVAIDEEGEPILLDLRELIRVPATRVNGQVGDADAHAELTNPRLVDPRNWRTPIAEDQRAERTSAALREQVLLRDGNRCRCCRSRHRLSAHHIWWRRMGGPTEPSNLLTLCDGCHSLVHVRLLVVLGEASGATFLDQHGRRIAPPEVEAFVFREQAVTSEAPPEPTSELVTLASMPAEIDGAWWSRHAALFQWNERRGALEITPGHLPPPVTHCEQEPGAGVIPHVPLSELVGHARQRERLSVEIAAATARRESLRHQLFTGPPGVGKTHLALAVASELRAPLVQLPAPQVKSPQVLLAALSSLPPGAVLFMDEIHALGGRIAETLYEALDGGTLTFPVREGLAQRSIRLRMPRFTLIGATTDEERMHPALLSRLSCSRLEFMALVEMTALLDRAARERGLELCPEAAALLAGASQDVPRQGLALLATVRDEATVVGATSVDVALVDRALERRGVSPDGLEPIHRAYLRELANRGRPIGLDAQAACLGARPAQIRDVVEPLLLRRGLIRIGAEGRMLA